MPLKDTAQNIRMTEEITVNIMDYANVEAMNICAIPFPPEVAELEMASLTAIAGEKVRCLRIAKAPVALECRRHVTLELGRSQKIIPDLILAMHIHEDSVNSEYSGAVALDTRT